MPKIEEQFDGGSLHYPTDLGVGFTHPDCVKITIGTNPGVSLGKLVDATKVVLNEAQGSRVSALQAEQKKLKQEQKNSPSNEKVERLNAISSSIASISGRRNSKEINVNVSDVPAIAQILIENGAETLNKFVGSVRDGDEKNVFTFLQSIYLPMPENLVYNEPIDWTGTDLGMMSSGADAVMGRNTSPDALSSAALGQAGNVLAGGAGAIVSKLLGGGLLGGSVLGALGGGNALQGAIESNLRIKANPFKEQTFQGVGFRPFEFSFVFNARSQTEVNTIRKIINTFRKHSKPSLESTESAIFNYPDEFKIEFLTLDRSAGQWVDNKYVPKLKQCVCKSVNTNFTTAGWKSFEEGAPTTITLQLGFEETDIITSGDVEIEGDGF